LRRVRAEVNELWRRVGEHNDAHPIPVPGDAMIRVTADGDCQPLNDASTPVTLPNPVNDCSG
jgi:hypothetical protein